MGITGVPFGRTEVLVPPLEPQERNIAGLKGSVDKYTTQTKRVQFLESLTDSANTGLADTFQETLMGPLTNLADAIPGKAFLLPFLKLAAQKTPLKGLIEGRAAAARDKMQDAKARDTIAGSGMEFNSKEEEVIKRQKNFREIEEEKEMEDELQDIKIDFYQPAMKEKPNTKVVLDFTQDKQEKQTHAKVKSPVYI